MFPYALASQAVAGMEDLAGELRRVVNAHDGALSIAHEDFEGATRDRFDSDASIAMSTLRAFADALDADADQLRDTIAVARWLDAQAAADEHGP